MRFESLGIEGSWLVEENRYPDDRGWFQQWFQLSTLAPITNNDFTVQQANFSKSQHGSIRGIHYSLAPQGQAKLVTVVSGAIEDFVIDIRVGSPTFGKWIKVNLDEETPKSLYISAGLGHAFQALRPNTVVSYVLSSEYSPEEEFSINPYCSTINLAWDTTTQHHVSVKDMNSDSLLEMQRENKLPLWRK